MFTPKVPVDQRWELYYKEITKTENDVELVFGSALFWNRGQNACLIDGKILLMPNESHPMGVHGEGAIVHKFQFEFIDLPADAGAANLTAADDNTADGIFVKPKDHLLIQMTLKQFYGNAITH